MGDLKEKYREIYTSLDYGPPSSARGITAAGHSLLLFQPCRALCVGSGNSYEAMILADNGFKVTTVDYHQPRPKRILWDRVSARGQELPFKDDTFGLVLCCECIEHIPEDDIAGFMLELRRVGRRFYFTIDDAPDHPPAGVEGTYHDSHICIHPPEWWVDKFNEWGFEGAMNKPPRYKATVNGKVIEITYNSLPVGRGMNFYGHKVFPQQVWKT